MYIYFCLVAVTQLIMEKQSEKLYLVRAFERLGKTTLTAMQVNNTEKLAIIDNIWIED